MITNRNRILEFARKDKLKPKSRLISDPPFQSITTKLSDFGKEIAANVSASLTEYDQLAQLQLWFEESASNMQQMAALYMCILADEGAELSSESREIINNLVDGTKPITTELTYVASDGDFWPVTLSIGADDSINVNIANIPVISDSIVADVSALTFQVNEEYAWTLDEIADDAARCSQNAKAMTDCAKYALLYGEDNVNGLTTELSSVSQAFSNEASAIASDCKEAYLSCGYGGILSVLKTYASRNLSMTEGSGTIDYVKDDYQVKDRYNFGSVLLGFLPQVVDVISTILMTAGNWILKIVGAGVNLIGKAATFFQDKATDPAAPTINWGIDNDYYAAPIFQHDIPERYLPTEITLALDQSDTGILRLMHPYYALFLWRPTSNPGMISCEVFLRPTLHGAQYVVAPFARASSPNTLAQPQAEAQDTFVTYRDGLSNSPLTYTVNGVTRNSSHDGRSDPDQAAPSPNAVLFTGNDEGGLGKSLCFSLGRWKDSSSTYDPNVPYIEDYVLAQKALAYGDNTQLSLALANVIGEDNQTSSWAHIPYWNSLISLNNLLANFAPFALRNAVAASDGLRVDVDVIMPDGADSNEDWLSLKSLSDLYVDSCNIKGMSFRNVSFDGTLHTSGDIIDYQRYSPKPVAYAVVDVEDNIVYPTEKWLSYLSNCNTFANTLPQIAGYARSGFSPIDYWNELSNLNSTTIFRCLILGHQSSALDQPFTGYLQTKFGTIMHYKTSNATEVDEETAMLVMRSWLVSALFQLSRMSGTSPDSYTVSYGNGEETTYRNYVGGLPTSDVLLYNPGSRKEMFMIPPDYSIKAIVGKYLMLFAVSAAAVATVVMAKSITKKIMTRKQVTQGLKLQRLRQEAVTNPTPANVKAYTKAVRTNNRFNSLFGTSDVSYQTGVATPAQVADSSSSLFDKISGLVSSDDSGDINLNTVLRKITG